jgi:hypothetical protein
MAALTIYNYFSTPRTEDAKTKKIKRVSFELSLPVFSKKTNWVCASLYTIVSFRRKSIVENAGLFLIDEKCYGIPHPRHPVTFD